jgi:hypothetical protein
MPLFGSPGLGLGGCTVLFFGPSSNFVKLRHCWHGVFFDYLAVGGALMAILIDPAVIIPFFTRVLLRYF